MIVAELLILIALLALNNVFLVLKVIDSDQTIEFLFDVITSLTNEIKRLEKEND